MANGRSILYLSYDGMTDPLGPSQVLPYLFALRRLGFEFDLISCEKPDRLAAGGAEIAASCKAAGINWHPLPYTKQPPVISTVRDLVAMRRLAERLHSTRKFDIIHCRSQLTALIGKALKRKYGTNLLFDMRGYWPDERVDGGLWNLRNPLYRGIYRWFRRSEDELLQSSDHVVSLTEVAQEQMVARDLSDLAPITVIPCCTDFAAFPPITSSARNAARELLQIDPQAPVAAYLGSIGTWYLLDEMLDFFREQLRRRNDSRFLLVTRDEAEPIETAAEARGIDRRSLIIRPASRAQVPQLLAAADYGLFFIKPAPSKAASSPVKLGELLGLELPIVTNSGVGDVDRIMEELGAGVLVPDFTADAYHAALDALARFEPDMERLRAGRSRWFELSEGVRRYAGIYETLESPK